MRWGLSTELCVSSKPWKFFERCSRGKRECFAGVSVGSFRKGHGICWCILLYVVYQALLCRDKVLIVYLLHLNAKLETRVIVGLRPSSPLGSSRQHNHTRGEIATHTTHTRIVCSIQQVYRTLATLQLQTRKQKRQSVCKDTSVIALVLIGPIKCWPYCPFA